MSDLKAKMQPYRLSPDPTGEAYSSRPDSQQD